MGSSREDQGGEKGDGGQGGEEVPGVKEETQHNLKQRDSRNTAWNFISRIKTDESPTLSTGDELREGGRRGGGGRERIFEFGRRMGARESVGSPSKRLRLQSTSSATFSNRTRAHPLCPPPAAWRCTPRRPPTPPTPSSSAGALPWPPPTVLAAEVKTEGRVVEIDSRGTGQAARGDRWWTLPVCSSSGSSSSLIKNRAGGTQPSVSLSVPVPSNLAKVPWVEEREGVRLPPEYCPALRPFKDTKHHHPPVLLERKEILISLILQSKPRRRLTCTGQGRKQGL
jgi:hypothetical protein